jgi:MoaA/NifB/PqqE/SkfB family radical SAM enzyme
MTGIHKLMVSIDGPPDVHDRIRGVNGAFRNAVDGIQKLRSRNERIKIGINYTISNYNYGYLRQTLELLEKEVGWDSFLFAHMSFVTEEMAQSHNNLYKDHRSSDVNMSGVELADVDTRILCSQISNIKERYKGRDIKFYPDIPLAKVQTYYRNPSVFVMPPRCVLPWISVNVASNGDVIVLNRCQMPSLGNLCRTPLEKIWNGRAYRDFRLRLKKAGAFPICGRCEGVAVK